MTKHSSSSISKDHLIVPSHHPMPGVDDQPIEAGGSTGAQLPEETNKGTGSAAGRKNSNKEEAKGFDPDVLSE